jgi:hypothetical protein
MHGGNISVESKYGVGTVFTIEIPVNITEIKGTEKETHSHMTENHIEKINIEFSDIYNRD